MTTTICFLPYYSSSATVIRPNFANAKIHGSDFDYPLASKIIVKNLSFSTSESCLQNEFSKFGQIAEVKLIKNEATKKSKGYAFIQYTAQEDAMLALESMDHKLFDGRILFVELAKLQIHDSGRFPKTVGPPQGQSLATEDDVNK